MKRRMSQRDLSIKTLQAAYSREGYKFVTYHPRDSKRISEIKIPGCNPIRARLSIESNGQMLFSAMKTDGSRALLTPEKKSGSRKRTPVQEIPEEIRRKCENVRIGLDRLKKEFVEIDRSLKK